MLSLLSRYKFFYYVLCEYFMRCVPNTVRRASYVPFTIGSTEPIDKFVYALIEC